MVVSAVIAEKATDLKRSVRGETLWTTELLFTTAFGNRNLQPEYELYKPRKWTKSKLELFITRKKLLKIKENLTVVRTGTGFKIQAYFHTFSQISPRLLRL